MELVEPAPRAEANVLVTFLTDEERAVTEETKGEERGASALPEHHPAWSRELVEFLLGPPDPLIERDQPAEPEREDLGL